MFQRAYSLGFAVVLFGILTGCKTPSGSSPTAADSVGANGVQITQLEGKLRVEIGGQLFTEYIYENTPRPYLYPVLGPNGAMMTRHWPMKDVPDEEHDHVHHRSLWYAHGDINGVDFWSEGPKTGKTIHKKFLEVKSGKKEGIIRSQNELVAPDGKVVATDERTLRFFNFPGAEKFLDFEITVNASNGDVVFGDTKEGTMAVRLAETMRLKGKVGKGHIVNSEGVRDDKTWGKRAAWCDYYGPVGTNTVGVAIFDHPSNPRHPTWWHVRDYGLFAANAFGVHEFEKKEPQAGVLAVPAGMKITFRYRFYFHNGDEKEARVAERYLEYIGQLKDRK